MKLCSNDCTDGYAMGVIAEFAIVFGSSTDGAILFAPYIEKLYNLTMERITKRDSTTKHLVLSNCAYTLGVLCLKGGQHYAPFVQKTYETIIALIQEFKNWEKEQKKPLESSEYRPLDEYGSALAKMILATPDSLPLPQCIPIFLDCLPLKDDQEEANFAYSACVKMITTFPEKYEGVVEPHLTQLLDIFKQVLQSESLDNKLLGFVIKGVNSILSMTKHEQSIQAHLNQWDAAEKQAFLAKVQEK